MWLCYLQWEYEKWKYEKDCQVVLFSVMTGKALRLNRDMTVDGIGDEKDKHGTAKFMLFTFVNDLT